MFWYSLLVHAGLGMGLGLIIGTLFSDEFSEYEVYVYELTTMLLGDANGTGTVSVDEYASVQSNFGATLGVGLGACPRTRHPVAAGPDRYGCFCKPPTVPAQGAGDNFAFFKKPLDNNTEGDIILGSND